MKHICNNPVTYVLDNTIHVYYTRVVGGINTSSYHHSIILPTHLHINTTTTTIHIYIYIYFTLLYYSFNYSIYYSIRVGVGVRGVYIIQLRLFAHANNKDKVILIKNISAY